MNTSIRIVRSWLQAARCLMVGLMLVAVTGCSPVSTVAKLAVKVVGDDVKKSEVNQKADDLMGQPVARAEEVLGPVTETLVEEATGRELRTYAVKHDVLSKHQWVVESERGRIVSVSMTDTDPDLSRDVVEKTYLKERLMGKTSQEVQTHKHFESPIHVLRSKNDGTILRIYDISSSLDFMGAKYCSLRFDRNDRCISIKMFGVPATTR